MKKFPFSNRPRSEKWHVNGYVIFGIIVSAFWSLIAITTLLCDPSRDAPAIAITLFFMAAFSGVFTIGFCGFEPTAEEKELLRQEKEKLRREQKRNKRLAKQVVNVQLAGFADQTDPSSVAWGALKGGILGGTPGAFIGAAVGERTRGVSKFLVTYGDGHTEVKLVSENTPLFRSLMQQANAIQAATPVPVSLFSIDGMNGLEFEHFCAKLLLENGFEKADVTPPSGDQGVDIIAIKEGIKYAIQCKNYASPLGNGPVQEVNAGKTFYNCHVGVVMTNSAFTSGAKELALATGVLLWDRTHVERLMCKAGIGSIPG